MKADILEYSKSEQQNAKSMDQQGVSEEQESTKALINLFSQDTSKLKQSQSNGKLNLREMYFQNLERIKK